MVFTGKMEISSSIKTEIIIKWCLFFSVMRHPSYFGFYWWAVGVQFLLLNPICLGLFIYWLQRFFSERIAYEEYTLLRFFGQEWTKYKEKTPTLMPFIP
jgi:protein-S-isoprenylcysteine O-methyltransferase